MTIDAGDRKILLVAFSILLITIILSVIVSPAEDDSSAYPSPYSTASGGAKAAYTLLSQIGYSVEHWRSAPARLQEHGIKTVLIVAVPTQNATPEDVESIRRYVQNGGRLLAIGPTSFPLLPHSQFAGGMPHFQWQSFSSLLPNGITRGAPEIMMAPRIYWRRDDSDSQIDYGDSSRGVVVSYRYGKGQIVWWAAADPLTNSGITQAANLQLLLNSVGPTSERTVLWDDYFHEGEVTIAESLLKSPLKWGMAQLGILALAVVFTYSRRHGPLRSLQQPSRLATLEFVETLGGLYQRAGATELPIQVAYERFRHQLHRKLGISMSATSRDIAERLETRTGETAAQIESMLTECESARYTEEIPTDDSLRLVNFLNLLAEKLSLNSKDQGAK